METKKPAVFKKGDVVTIKTENLRTTVFESMKHHLGKTGVITATRLYYSDVKIKGESVEYGWRNTDLELCNTQLQQILEIESIL